MPSVRASSLCLFLFSCCAVQASSSPSGAVCFPWRFVCRALGGSSSALRTCNSILLFHRQGKLHISVNGCIFVFQFLRSYGSSWFVRIIRMKLIRMRHTDQHQLHHPILLSNHWFPTKLEGTPTFPTLNISSNKIFLPKPDHSFHKQHKWSPSSNTSVCVRYYNHLHRHESVFMSNWSSPLQSIISGSKHLQRNPDKFSLQKGHSFY